MRFLLNFKTDLFTENRRLQSGPEPSAPQKSTQSTFLGIIFGLGAFGALIDVESELEDIVGQVSVVVGQCPTNSVFQDVPELAPPSSAQSLTEGALPIACIAMLLSLQ